MRRALGVSVTAIAALAAAAGSAGAASAASPHASGARHFAETEAGIRLSATGNRFEDTFKIKSGTFGYGSAIRDVTLTGDKFPASGKASTVSWYRDGRLTTNETIALGAPLTDGVGAITGTGTCQSGTFKHQGETCTYTIKGTYDLTTGRVFMTLSGTYTPASPTTRKKK